ncbi:hypothetical protein HMPREF0204_12047 [Chryseobacterium gleum ATCC 35910]|uniref:Uncharacterized protein n=1 Tax=Chryseobacterium gleum ATCC 35910 TaxID=525257 RepID=A0ABN0AIV0_CHRGE|nr:hypothetical protein HMPREF0204_12047 [Chryseobacterium gleum ATCC 35910]
MLRKNNHSDYKKFRLFLRNSLFYFYKWCQEFKPLSFFKRL